MDLGLDGARALVGGGSSGLGLAVGSALAGEGARVALVARPSDRLEAAASGLDGAIAVGADLESRDGPRTPSSGRSRHSAALTSCSSTPAAPLPGCSTTLTKPPGSARSTARSRARSGSDPRGAPAPAGERPPVDPRDPLLVGQGADPRADRLQHDPPRPDGPHQVAQRRDRACAHQRTWRPADSRRHASSRSTSRPRSGPASRPTRSAPRRSPGSRSVGMASRPSSVVSGHSCCRPRRPT